MKLSPEKYFHCFIYYYGSTLCFAEDCIFNYMIIVITQLKMKQLQHYLNNQNLYASKMAIRYLSKSIYIY